MSKRIALLEDEPVLLGLLQEVLQLEGYQVTRPDNLDTLLEELRTLRPDAVLMDVHLQNADGLDLLRKIRADQELRDLFVILSSGMDYQQKSQQAGANAFLMKPYSPSSLLDLLKAQLTD